MSNTTISGAGIFSCPACNEMIYSDARVCRFCSTPVDRDVAEHAAQLQAQVNTACNQAKMLRHFAVSMWVLAIVGTIFGAVAWASFGLMLAIPVWLVYWQLRFAKLETSDPDFTRAKRDRLIAFFIWLPAPFVNLVLTILSL